ncbi:MinD-like ATPase involved in chromosome partitioning or flagellar assembly [Knoellia remsis]|uniref:MinD-like ATPase involved in chromosome partitioning or flagellar assembly n=1 Tax=Knoellia remsis TaxID=407159 RepID=A0A2T0UY38_9MICO|nr:hypothetical protein [Knoellia remsis]PRY62832.1 MinD-like ATPase involved in chromosome partitioning or flagellar assembly [Knoellia remsis]
MTDDTSPSGVSQRDPGAWQDAMMQRLQNPVADHVTQPSFAATRDDEQARATGSVESGAHGIPHPATTHTLYRALSMRPAQNGGKRLLAETGRAFVGNDLPRRLAEAGEQAHRPVSTGRRLLVVGARGGAGTTTTTVALARTFAALRQDRVGVASLDTDLGSIASRLGVAPDLAATDVLARLTSAADPEQSVSVFADVDGRVSAVTAGSKGDVELDLLMRTMSRIFPVTLVDGGRATAQPPRAGQPHGVLLVAPLGIQGASSARSLLEYWTAAGRPEHVRVVLVDRDRDRTVQARRETEALADFDVPVSVLPHDAHLRAGARVVHRLMAERTRVFLAELAAAALTDVLAAVDEPAGHKAP